MLMKKKIIHRISSQDMINSEVTSNFSEVWGLIRVFTIGGLETYSGGEFRSV